jgi:putative transposon-encoded protein
MRNIELNKGKVVLKDEVETMYEKIVTPFGTSAKIDAPKRFRGRRAYVLILKE